MKTNGIEMPPMLGCDLNLTKKKMEGKNQIEISIDAEAAYS